MNRTSFYIDEDSQEEVETSLPTDNRQALPLSREHIAFLTKPLPALPPSVPPSVPAMLPVELPANPPTNLPVELPIARFFLTEYDRPTPEPEPEPLKPTIIPVADSSGSTNANSIVPPDSRFALAKHDQLNPEPTKPTVTDSGVPSSSVPSLAPDSDLRISTTLNRSSQGTLVAAEDPKPTPLVAETKPRRSYTAKELQLRTERNIKYFQDSVLTIDRLRMLGNRWLDRGILKNVLSYCKPFTITLCRTDLPSSYDIDIQFLRSDKDLVTIDHHDLFKYLAEGNHWDDFSRSFRRAWPIEFGSLTGADESCPHYLWPHDALITDEEAAIICRKSAPRGLGYQALLASLFRGFNLSVYPKDNMLWYAS